MRLEGDSRAQPAYEPSGGQAGLVATACLVAVLSQFATAHAQDSGEIPFATSTEVAAGKADPGISRVEAAHAAASAPAEPVAVAKMPAAPEEPAMASADAADAIGWRDLFLEVFINDRSTGLIGNFKETPDGELAAEPGELAEVGLKPDPEALAADGMVRLERLPGVGYRLDEENQRLYVETGMEGRSTREIDLATAPDEDRLAPVSGYGAVLNYSLFATSNNIADSDNDLLEGVSGDFDARVFTPFGTLNQSFITGYTNGELRGVTRLSTTWAYSDPKRLLTYRAGDMISSGLSWTRPIYMGGLQVERNFALRPDLVTLPLPSFQGTAAVPSTIEVYAQNAQTYTGEVGEGPFKLDNLPVYAGAGEARVVLRDSLGRETEASLPFYTSSDMLAKGLLDFSVQAGFPRRSYGTDSFDYDERVYGIASARYGLADWITVEGHTEVGADLVNGGLGAVVPLAHYGAMSVAAAASYSDGATGLLVNASVELSYAGWTFFGRAQRTFDDYKDVASITSDAASRGLPGARLPNANVPRALDQVAVSVPMPLDMSSLNVSYTHIEQANGDSSQVVGMSVSRQVGKISIYATAFADIEDDDSFGVFAGLSMPLGENITAATAVDYGPAGASVSAEISKPESLEDGSYGWRVRASAGKTIDSRASGSYRSPWARFEAGIQQYDDMVRANAQVDGAIAVAGGGVFATNRIDDSFAVVDVGAPDVEVLYQNRPVGKSNSRGKKLVTGLVSYERNTIAIDPKSLPVDAQVTSTKDVVVPAGQTGVVIDFGVKETSQAAIVTLLDAAGKPLEAGLNGQLEGGEEFVVGYDGQTYINGLGRANQVTVTTGFGASCTANFAYKPSRGEQVVIDGVRCE